jgi:hypothetical protein
MMSAARGMVNDVAILGKSPRGRTRTPPPIRAGQRTKKKSETPKAAAMRP